MGSIWYHPCYEMKIFFSTPSYLTDHNTLPLGLPITGDNAALEVDVGALLTQGAKCEDSEGVILFYFIF